MCNFLFHIAYSLFSPLIQLKVTESLMKDNRSTAVNLALELCDVGTSLSSLGDGL